MDEPEKNTRPPAAFVAIALALGAVAGNAYALHEIAGVQRQVEAIDATKRFYYNSEVPGVEFKVSGPGGKWEVPSDAQLKKEIEAANHPEKWTPKPNCHVFVDGPRSYKLLPPDRHSTTSSSYWLAGHWEKCTASNTQDYERWRLSSDYPASTKLNSLPKCAKNYANAPCIVDGPNFDDPAAPHCKPCWDGVKTWTPNGVPHPRSKPTGGAPNPLHRPHAKAEGLPVWFRRQWNTAHLCRDGVTMIDAKRGCFDKDHAAWTADTDHLEQGGPCDGRVDPRACHVNPETGKAERVPLW